MSESFWITPGSVVIRAARIAAGSVGLSSRSSMEAGGLMSAGPTMAVPVLADSAIASSRPLVSGTADVEGGGVAGRCTVRISLSSKLSGLACSAGPGCIRRNGMMQAISPLLQKVKEKKFSE